jgi:hypothetical protein
MDWDWGRPLGARPGEYSRTGKVLTTLWLVLGVSWFTGWLVHLLPWPALVLAMACALVSFISLAMAAGLITRRKR